MLQRVAAGERLSREEVLEMLDSERPQQTHERPTGRTSRTGTVRPKTARESRTHAAKWAAREERHAQSLVERKED